MGQSAQLLERERRGFRNVLSVLSVLSAGPVTKRAELTNLRRCFLDVGNHLSWPLGRHRFHMPQVFISSPEDTAGPRTPLSWPARFFATGHKQYASKQSTRRPGRLLTAHVKSECERVNYQVKSVYTNINKKTTDNHTEAYRSGGQQWWKGVGGYDGGVSSRGDTSS